MFERGWEPGSGGIDIRLFSRVSGTLRKKQNKTLVNVLIFVVSLD